MSDSSSQVARQIDEAAVLRALVEGTAAETGQAFFAALVRSLSDVLQTRGAWVTEYLPERHRLRAMAFWLDGQWVDHYEYDIGGTPCEPVIQQAALVHFPDDVVQRFPRDLDLRKYGAVSYMGAPLLTHEGCVMGNLAVMDDRPMRDEPRLMDAFRIFAARAAAELDRIRADARARERQQQLDGLVESAIDAIVQVDEDLRIILANPAAGRLFGCDAPGLAGRPAGQLFTDASAARLRTLIEQIVRRPAGQRQQWVPSGLEARNTAGHVFPADITLSCSESAGRNRCTLILRSIDERVAAENQIRRLSAETELLREEIRALRSGDNLIGQSSSFMQVLRDIDQVAQTDASVLILGETGTGKELVARAIHAASRRRVKPLITVNCAALPATLVESEFFGHEKGAFTGATGRREGRFTLADGGTIFLDEVGELPLDLQAKLLRVLQEGTFEPVGSTHTRTVDVRVVAATNRDLSKAVEQGTFRSDLYYRLNVFPMWVPPLRHRGADIPLLAWHFAQRYAKQLGRSIRPLSEECIARLQAYPWPGNVRELQNVIERAIITSRDGQLDLRRCLPDAAMDAPAAPEPSDREIGQRILTALELTDLERRNIILALESANGRIAGANGAAALLGMPPSTLASRMKSLGIRRA